VQRWIWSGEAALMLSRRVEASHPGLLRRLNQAIRSLQAEGGLRERAVGALPGTAGKALSATRINARSGARGPGPR
jgi:hypothetical protein